MKINASYVTSTGDITGAFYVGGLIGSGYSDTTASSLTNGTVNGTITGEYYVGGLAGKIENVKIANSTNENTTINATGFYLDTNTNLYYAYVGGYVGYGYAFENCENNSDITYTQKGDFVGGIAGYAHGVINNCTNTGNIITTNSNYVGGIVGYVHLWGDCSITDLMNSGEIKGKNNVGGIAGHINNYVNVNKDGYPTYTLTLTNLINNGAITGESNVGGLAGRVNVHGDNSYWSSRDAYVKIAAAFISNSANVTGASEVGGLIGYATSDTNSSTLTEYTQTGKVTGTGENVDNLIGYNSNVSFVG